MKCRVCDNDASYNRAIVDVVRDSLMGSICVECEQAEFGNVLQSHAIATQTCLLCPRDGNIALPVWEPETYRDDGAITCDSRWSLDEDTPRLCGEHLEEIHNRQAEDTEINLSVSWNPDVPQ